MAASWPRRQNAILLVLLLAAQMLLMSGSVRGSSRVARVESAVMWVSSPVVRLSRFFSGSISGTTSALRELLLARGRNVILEQNVRQLNDELQRHREAEREVVRLRELLMLQQELVPGSLAARVVTANFSDQTRMIVVNRGSRHGVRVDMAALAWGGAVGRVVVADPNHAKIRLLTDANSGVAASVQRSRARGLVFGTGTSRLELRFVPRFSDVVHGDRVVTSGLGGVFPSGFGIGRVTSIRQDADGTQTIELAPSLDYRSLEEVLIVIPQEAEEPS